ncbi:MAG: murein hydrolase activator EnvC family protein [Chitinophagaceae bacterium]
MRLLPSIFGLPVLLFCCMLPVLSRAQQPATTRAELEQQREQLQKDIQRATQNLNLVQKNKRRTMVQLHILDNKMRLRHKLVSNINQEINFINGDINKANNDIASLQKDLDTLRAQYGRLVVYAYKNRSAYDFLNFILSANSFNDAIKRFEYLKQYRTYRQNQAASIIQTQLDLKEKINNLDAMKDKRSTVLVSEEGQMQKIENEKQEKNDMVKSLKGHEKELMANIREKRFQSNQLSLKIAAVIRREIEEAERRAAAEARQRAEAEARARALAEAKEAAPSSNPSREASTPSRPSSVSTSSSSRPSPQPVAAEAPKARPVNVLESTPEALALSESFESNRGKLPWPVSKAIIISTFGIHQNPVMEKITEDNKGITLETEANAPVHAVFNGEVASVFPVSNRWTVVIRHGQYFTVYSNLKDAVVQTGEQVRTMQTVGTVYTNPTTGESDLDFQIYKSQQPVDPQIWLRSM